MNSFWDWFWLLIWTFVFVCYLMVLFQIIIDLFRDKDLSGWWKALWIIFLIIFPFLAALGLLDRSRQGNGRAACGRDATGSGCHRSVHPVRGQQEQPC